MATTTATITITISATLPTKSVISDIKRHLSVIGKRLYNKEGKNMFSDITLSSAEDTDILTQYINASAQDVEAALKQLITASTYTDSTITMSVTNNRGDTDFGARVQALADSYVRLNSIGEYLSMVHPDLAQKYQRDAQQRIESLVSYVFYKKPFEETTEPSQPSASVAPYTPPTPSEDDVPAPEPGEPIDPETPV